MPELPVTYRVRPLKMVLLVVGSGLFVWGGFWIRSDQPFVAWLTIIFFGLCGLVGLVGLLPNSTYLTLTDRGFEISSLYRKHFVSWPEVDSFRPVRIQSKRAVGWNYSPGYSKSQRLRRLSTTIAGVEAALPDTYGMSVQELADLMNQLKDLNAVSAVKPQGQSYQPNVNA